jgi:hypothetical protein
MESRKEASAARMKKRNLIFVFASLIMHGRELAIALGEDGATVQEAMRRHDEGY